MATFGSMTYFQKVGQEPTKCKNDCDTWQIQLLTMSKLLTQKNCSEKSCMLPFPNDLKHFRVCTTFHLTAIVQNVGYNWTIL